MNNYHNDLDLLPEGQTAQVTDLSDSEGDSTPLLLAQGEMSSDPHMKESALAIFTDFSARRWCGAYFQVVAGPDLHARIEYILRIPPSEWTAADKPIWDATTQEGSGGCQDYPP